MDYSCKKNWKIKTTNNKQYYCNPDCCREAEREIYNIGYHCVDRTGKRHDTEDLYKKRTKNQSINKCKYYSKKKKTL